MFKTIDDYPPETYPYVQGQRQMLVVTVLIAAVLAAIAVEAFGNRAEAASLRVENEKLRGIISAKGRSCISLLQDVVVTRIMSGKDVGAP